MYHYYQVEGGSETWKPIQADFLGRMIAEKSPMFVTVLATDKIATPDMAREEKLNLKYSGPMYVDFDSADIEEAIKDLQSFCKAVVDKTSLDTAALNIFASGGKGFHVEIPLAAFVPKVAKTGYANLPLAYKSLATQFAEDSMDWRVYSIGMGRQWRRPNVMRPNGKYKVALSWDQMLELTAQEVDRLTSEPGEIVQPYTGDMNLDLAVMFDKALQDTNERVKAYKKRKPVSPDVFRRPMPSIDLLMEGKGVATTAGFNQLAMQLAIYAREAGIDEDALVAKCDGLVHLDVFTGRYNSADRRIQELRRMCQVIGDDPCYEFSAAPLRALLTHSAPDLDGIAVDAEEIARDVAEAETAVPSEERSLLDEYSDVAGGVELTKYGMYADTEFGKKRISAVGLDDVRVLRSMESGKIACLDAEILVNGKRSGRQVIELESFMSAANLNRMMSRYGHAFQGTEAQVKSAYMRVVEKGKKQGTDVFVHEREGLALVNIPHHAHERLRRPFLIWADGQGVTMEPSAAETGIVINFQGTPDPRGVYRCDLSDAPKLVPWLEEEGNREKMKEMFQNLFRCQKPDMVGPLLGWLVACFYKSIFQKAYNQFPLMHIAGAAGSGKSQMTMSMARLFYYNQEPKSVSPSSTVFALTQGASGSDSIPMMIDEYKPSDMAPGLHDRFRLLFRDAYNARGIQRGGGNRDNDNFKALSTTTLTAPIMFIAEGLEEEAALMERVVLVTVAPPPTIIAHKWAGRFYAFKRQANLLAIVGKYIAAGLIGKGYGTDELFAEFDPLYMEARDRLMLTEKDAQADLSPETIRDKQAARERSVFNFTVARFGLVKLQEILADIFGEAEFKGDFNDFLAASYTRMRDLAPVTVPEYLKLLNIMVDLSYESAELAQSIRYGFEYGMGNIGGRDTLELNVRASYARYRQHCRLTAVKPLYSGEQSFSHGLRNVPSLIHIGEGEVIQAPGGVHVFDMADLMRQGLRGFKSPRGRR